MGAKNAYRFPFWARISTFPLLQERLLIPEINPQSGGSLWKKMWITDGNYKEKSFIPLLSNRHGVW
jgi:hypothetical protein